MQSLLIHLYLTGLFLPEGNQEIAKVNRLMDIGIYINAVPTRPYDTVKTKDNKPVYITTKKDFNTYPGISTENRVKGIKDAVDDLAYKAVRKGKKKPISGIITMDCKTALAVKFKPEKDDKLIDRAKVNEVKGLRIFVRNTPLTEYKVLYEVKLPTALNFEFTGYKNFNEMLEKLADLALKEGSPDALITEDGISAKAIRLKKTEN